MRPYAQHIAAVLAAQQSAAQQSPPAAVPDADLRDSVEAAVSSETTRAGHPRRFRLKPYEHALDRMSGAGAVRLQPGSPRSFALSPEALGEWAAHGRVRVRGRPRQTQSSTGAAGTPISCPRGTPISCPAPTASTVGLRTSGLANATVLQDDAGDALQCMLLVHKAHRDEFVVLRALQSASGQCVLSTLRGAVGTAGLETTDMQASPDAARAAFLDAFREATRTAWSERLVQDAVRGCARWLRGWDSGAATLVQWQYYVDDHVDGKATGWYNYEHDASIVVENLHAEWLRLGDDFIKTVPHHDTQAAPRPGVHVQSGQFTYFVNFVPDPGSGLMQQTNVDHTNHTQRNVRRQVAALPAA